MLPHRLFQRLTYLCNNRRKGTLCDTVPNLNNWRILPRWERLLCRAIFFYPFFVWNVYVLDLAFLYNLNKYFGLFVFHARVKIITFIIFYKILFLLVEHCFIACIVSVFVVGMNLSQRQTPMSIFVYVLSNIHFVFIMRQNKNITVVRFIRARIVVKFHEHFIFRFNVELQRIQTPVTFGFYPPFQNEFKF